MTVLLYIITFAIVIGIALLNVCIGRYFHQKMQTLEFDKMQLKIFDIASATLGILSAILLLPFLFWANEACLVGFVICIALWGGLLSCFDYQICSRDHQDFVWWGKMSKFDKSILVIMLMLTICLAYYNPSLYAIFHLLAFDVFFVYVLLLKKMKNQQKISYPFTGKYIKFATVALNNLFYYAAWLVIWIYVVSMILGIISRSSDPYDTDTCLDIGICKEGYTFNDCGDGLPCTITKESCIENNNIWYEDTRTCDIRNTVK